METKRRLLFTLKVFGIKKGLQITRMSRAKAMTILNGEEISISAKDKINKAYSEALYHKDSKLRIDLDDDLKIPNNRIAGINRKRSSSGGSNNFKGFGVSDIYM